MRVVADTNTVLSGLLWLGPPRRLLDRARERALALCTSATLLAELAEVIAREKFVQRAQAAGLSAAELVQDYERLAEIVEPELPPAPVSRDPDDDHVLACALAAQAQLIAPEIRPAYPVPASRHPHSRLRGGFATSGC